MIKVGTALFVVASLVGCAGTTKTPLASRDESMWCPPEEEMRMTTEQRASIARSEQATSFRPNVQERPKHAIRPATY